MKERMHLELLGEQRRDYLSINLPMPPILLWLKQGTPGRKDGPYHLLVRPADLPQQYLFLQRQLLPFQLPSFSLFQRSMKALDTLILRSRLEVVEHVRLVFLLEGLAIKIREALFVEDVS